MTFQEKYQRRLKAVDSLLSVGLDADVAKLPARFQKLSQPQFEFNKWIIDQTHPFVVAYKPNVAFYEAQGAQGWQELAVTMEYLQKNYPDIVTIADAKRADIENTNLGYVTAIFDTLQFDAITLHPYLGKQALQPFLDRADKGCIILCKTSNPGSAEIQDVVLESGKKLYLQLAQHIATDWNQQGNCLLVVGATYPKELAAVRAVVPNMTLLIPGIGAQGGDVKATVEAGQNAAGDGIIINSARGIIFAANPAKSAQQLQVEINHFRKR